MKFSTFALLIFLLIAAACKHDPDLTAIPDDPQPPVPTAGCDPDTVYFVNTVLPLLQSSCAMSGCHDAATARDGVILTDYNRIMITGDVKPGNASDSKIYEVLSDDGDDRMPPPPAAPLSAEQKALLAKWINQGALNNACTDTNCDTLNVTFSATVMPIIEANCMGCHSGAAPNGGIRLTNYTEVETIASTGQLIGSITHASGYAAMPPSGQLSDCQISQLKKWIANGKPNN
ncbi:MAG: c-type cytochrome [Bacteroidales bacterium]|nr:c-type cytochrome [Bacteroidales bacterium]